LSFSTDISAFVKKVEGNSDQVVRKTVMAITNEIIERSPVGDATYWKSKPPAGYVGGHFRGSWMMGINRLPTEDPGTIDPSGNATLSRAAAEIPRKAAGNVFYCASNLPYSMRIEEGWSRQAPQGVVGLTVLRFQEFIRAALGELK